VSDGGIPSNTIVVVGEGSANVTADSATLSVALDIRAPSPGEALAQVSERAQAVLTAARGQGLLDRDLRTRAISVLPELDHPSERVLGYLASYTLEVRLRVIPLAPRIIDVLVDAAGDAVRLGGFHLTASVPESAQAEASTQAVQDGPSRAERLATVAGVRVGRALSIAEDDAPGRVRPFVTAAAFSASRAMPPVEAGSDEVSIRVRVTFELTA
jgi:uncharacterized protein